VPGDLASGEGIEAAVAGTEIVLHLPGGQRRRRRGQGGAPGPGGGTGRGGPAPLPADGHLIGSAAR
jgi:hypothetical protein